MRAFLIPALLILLGGSLAVLAIIWLRGLLRRAGASDDRIARVLSANGAARCIEAVRLLDELVQRGAGAGLVTAWERIEMPLLQALPDCPPDYKVELINALDAAARLCPRRETSASMLTMRNSLLA
jgi:hypothetical protein